MKNKSVKNDFSNYQFLEKIYKDAVQFFEESLKTDPLSFLKKYFLTSYVDFKHNNTLSVAYYFSAFVFQHWCEVNNKASNIPYYQNHFTEPDTYSYIDDKNAVVYSLTQHEMNVFKTFIDVRNTSYFKDERISLPKFETLHHRETYYYYDIPLHLMTVLLTNITDYHMSKENFKKYKDDYLYVSLYKTTNEAENAISHLEDCLTLLHEQYVLSHMTESLRQFWIKELTTFREKLLIEVIKTEQESTFDSVPAYLVNQTKKMFSTSSSNLLVQVFTISLLIVALVLLIIFIF